MPLLLVPAISPIYGNAPGFLTGEVRPDGTLASTEEYSFADGVWKALGGSRSLGVPSYTGKNLVALQHRLTENRNLRERYATLYLGTTAWKEITEWNWPSYKCASVAFSAGAFRECVGTGGFSILTTRGLEIVGSAVVVAAVILGIVVAAIWRALRSHAAPADKTV